jgi:hypothetical protein
MPLPDRVVLTYESRESSLGQRAIIISLQVLIVDDRIQFPIRKNSDLSRLAQMLRYVAFKSERMLYG